jgi:hypothetical protein
LTVIGLNSIFIFLSIFCRSKLTHNGYVLAMVGHLKNVSSTFVQMPNRSKSVEFTTVSHTIANTMLAAVLFF